MPLTQQQIDNFKKKAAAGGYTESQINSEIQRKQQETSAVQQNVQTTQQSTQQPDQQQGLVSKVGGVLGNILKSAAQPAIDFTKFVGEAGAQGKRALTDPLMRKATFQPNQLTNEELIELGKKKGSFFIDEEEIKDRGQIALTGSKRTAGAAAYAIPGGQSTLAGRVGATGLSGLLSGYGSSEKGKEVTDTLGGAAIGLTTGLAFEGLGKFGSYLKERRLARADKKITPVVVSGAKLKGDPFFAQKLETMQKTADALGISDNLSSNEKMSIINKAFDAGQSSIDDILKNSDSIPQDQLQGIFNKHYSQLDVDGSKSSVKSIWKIALKKMSDASDNNVNLNQLKKAARSEMGNAFNKQGSNLTDKQKIWSVVYDTAKEALDGVSPEIRTINNFQRDLFPLADEFAIAAKKSTKEVGVKLPFLTGADIPTPVTREQFSSGARGVGGKLANILKAPFRAAGAGAEGVGAVASSLQGQLAPARNVLLQNILGAGAGQTEQVGQDTQPIIDTEAQDTTQGGKGLGEFLTPEILSMGVLSGEISSSDITALQSLGILEKPEGSKTQAQQSASQAQQMAQSAYELLKTGNIKTGMIGAPIEQLKAKFGKGDQPTIDFNVAIGNIRGMIAKSRAGTSFTANEEKMLNTYVPDVGDSKQELETKLRLLQTEAGKNALQQLLTPAEET